MINHIIYIYINVSFTRIYCNLRTKWNTVYKAITIAPQQIHSEILLIIIGEGKNSIKTQMGGMMLYPHCCTPTLRCLINYVDTKSFYMFTRNVTYIKLGLLSN